MVPPLFKNEGLEDLITFDQVYNQYHQVIYSNIFKLIKDPCIAEDILQDVFFALWENKDKIDERPVSAWLFVVSYNKSISYLKKKVNESIQYVENYEFYQSVAEEIFPDKALIEAQLNILEDAVNALSPQRQKVFRLCRLEGKSQKETAIILGLSTESVKDYLKQSKYFIQKYVSSKHASDSIAGISIILILSNL